MRYALCLVVLTTCAPPEPSPATRVGVTVVNPVPASPASSAPPPLVPDTASAETAERMLARAPSAPEVHFSPRGGCEAALVRHIQKARTSIHVLAYSFTSKPIGDALIAAHARGVKVRIILDKSGVTAVQSELADFEVNKVPTLIDTKHAIAHNKVMIFDMKVVETGSFNFSAAAEASNAENCLFLPDLALVDAYYADWQVHEAHAAPRKR